MACILSSIAHLYTQAMRRETQMGHTRMDDEHFSTHGASAASLVPTHTGESPFHAALPMFAMSFRDRDDPAGVDDEVKDGGNDEAV
jgi:hypothetical protein